MTGNEVFISCYGKFGNICENSITRTGKEIHYSAMIDRTLQKIEVQCDAIDIL
jgi:hypothetical protein